MLSKNAKKHTLQAVFLFACSFPIILSIACCGSGRNLWPGHVTPLLMHNSWGHVPGPSVPGRKSLGIMGGTGKYQLIFSSSLADPGVARGLLYKQLRNSFVK